ncbi:unnamed protein product [Lymnaea stagnalis]|uniref:Large ribosomal subunit protein bL9m n=1 Tax=Lymnaea stagnalis TaxID=6523 RepID=A0AAV2HSX9_LYMST
MFSGDLCRNPKQIMATTLGVLRVCVKCLRPPTKRLGRLCVVSAVSKQQQRNHTIVMERVFPLPAGKDGGLPHPNDVNETHKILRHVEIVEYPTELACILTDYVEGIGIRGDLVKVKKEVFHNDLYPAGLAVYASPENIDEFEEERKAKGIDKSEMRLGVFARMAIKELNHMHLEIPMNDKVEWTLDKQHVQVAFRTQGIELLEECLVLPEEPISTFQDLVVKVWINGLESVDVKATIVPISQKFAPAKAVKK